MERSEGLSGVQGVALQANIICLTEADRVFLPSRQRRLLPEANIGSDYVFKF
jgi:hypothetical protein